MTRSGHEAELPQRLFLTQSEHRCLHRHIPPAVYRLGAKSALFRAIFIVEARIERRLAETIVADVGG